MDSVVHHGHIVHIVPTFPVAITVVHAHGRLGTLNALLQVFGQALGLFLSLFACNKDSQLSISIEHRDLNTFPVSIIIHSQTYQGHQCRSHVRLTSSTSMFYKN